MSWCVRYGFGKDSKLAEEKFLLSGDDVDDDNVFIETSTCFSGFYDKRKKYLGVTNSLLYYSLSCYESWLKELIDWINSLNNGIEVKLLKSAVQCYLVSVIYKTNLETFFVETINQDFEFGKECIQVYEGGIGGVESLQIHRCAISISVTGNSVNLPKILLEYLILVLFRTLSVDEYYFQCMPNEGSIIERIFKGSTNVRKFSNHCLYEEKLSIDDFTKCLDIKNVEKVFNSMYYFRQLKQTKLIDLILERINN